jgi:type I restriction enzyme S subunit
MKKIEQLGSGTTFKEVSRGSLTSFPVIVPDKKTLDAFNSSIKPLFEKQLVNTKQIEALTTQRNTLLPLLMTGQIEV